MYFEGRCTMGAEVLLHHRLVGRKVVLGMKTRNAKMVVLVAVFMMIASIFSSMPVLADDGDLDISNYVILETGTKPISDWDGGDYVAINMTKNGAYAWFGVIYGNEDNPNGIVIVSAVVRFLGAAEVYETNGNFVSSRPIPILTIFGQKLSFLLEYEDSGEFPSPLGQNVYDYNSDYDGNGMFDFLKNEENPGFWAISDDHEPVNKAIDLRRAWDRSEIVETSIVGEPEVKSWDFSLTSTDIPYGIEQDNGDMVLTSPGDVLEKLEFTFHISANMSEIDVTGVPWYKVTVDSGNHKSIVDSEFMYTKDYSGRSVRSEFKFDHLIEGWDYTTGDGLVLINHGFFANAADDHTINWLEEEFMDDIKGKGKAEYTGLDPTQADVTGAVIENDGTTTDADGDGVADARIVEKEIIKFKDNWQEIGELTWVSNATIDGNESDIHYQVHGGQPFEGDENNSHFTGFIIQGGYLYPVGERIFHDPAVITNALIFDLALRFGLLPNEAVGLQFFLATIGLVGIGSVTFIKKNKEEKKKNDT